MQSLLLALAYTNVLETHLAAMDETDTGSLQVMAAAKRAAVATGQILRILENCPAVLHVLAIIDGRTSLGTPLDLRSHGQ